MSELAPNGWHLLSREELPPLDMKKLVPFGFVAGERGYFLSCALEGCDLVLSVLVDDRGSASARVEDPDTKQPYILHLVESAQGAFVGRVREEYEKVLSEIAKGCALYGEADSLASDLIYFAREKWGTLPDYPWDDLDAFVLRCESSGKWYALFMRVLPKRIGLAGKEPALILNLHGTQGDVAALVDGEMILPAYHMNKKTWYTVPLDGRVPCERILPLLEKSYELAAGAKKETLRKEDVLALVRRIPRGHVATYGQLARLLGKPRHSRLVGRILGQSGEGAPCHRVVDSTGRLAEAFHEQAARLTAEGVAIKNGRVSLRDYGWKEGV